MDSSWTCSLCQGATYHANMIPLKPERLAAIQDLTAQLTGLVGPAWGQAPRTLQTAAACPGHCLCNTLAVLFEAVLLLLTGALEWNKPPAFYREACSTAEKQSRRGACCQPCVVPQLCCPLCSRQCLEGPAQHGACTGSGLGGDPQATLATLFLHSSCSESHAPLG